MPVPTFTNYVNGDTITTTAWEANMDAARAWVNDLGDSDFSSNSIRSENLVRPVISGFPNQSVESTFQSVWWFSYGNLEFPNVGTFGVSTPGAFPNANPSPTWGSSRHRLTILPLQTPVGVPWALPIGKTIYLPETRDVLVNVSFDFLVSQAVASLIYPDGAGGAGGATAGRFVIMRQARTVGATATEESLTFTPVYPSGNATWDSKPMMGNITGYQSLSAGVHDIFLAYRRSSSDTASASLFQIDVTRVLGKIEAY
jgi:hypothetical protein